MDIELKYSYLKTGKEKKEVKENEHVIYYPKGRDVRNIFVFGTIHKDNNGFYIEWDDGHDKTRLDGSDHTKNVLSTTEWV